MPGIRRSTSRANASAARRVAVKPFPRSTLALMWRPRLPLVFGNPVSPCSARTSRDVSATLRTSSHGTPGVGSRSTRNSSGRATSSARTGHGLHSRQPSVAAHTSAASSAITGIAAVRPLGNITVAVRTQSGAPFGIRF